MRVNESSKLEAQASCSKAGCKYTATVRGKKSKHKAVEAIEEKLQKHAPKCPTK